jgi:hypothetical protein
MYGLKAAPFRKASFSAACEVHPRPGVPQEIWVEHWGEEGHPSDFLSNLMRL